ncbi:hypothetical protein [Rufibacter soli]
MPQFRFNETKTRETAERMEAKKVRVHPEGVSYYAGVVVMHNGKWDEKVLGILRNHTQEQPFEVCFGGFCSMDYCEEVKEVVAV